MPQSLVERCEAEILAYPYWSVVEWERMPELIAEIMEHVRDGGGNPFIQEWCDRNLPICPTCGNTENLETDQTGGRFSCERCELVWGFPR